MVGCIIPMMKLRRRSRPITFVELLLILVRKLLLRQMNICRTSSLLNNKIQLNGGLISIYIDSYIEIYILFADNVDTKWVP